MSAISTTVIGNLTADPELRFTPTGTPVAVFTVASNERFRDQSGQWQDGPTSFVRCNAWRHLAEHIAESAAKGDRLIVTGTFRQRGYETASDEKRTVWELAVSEAGAAMTYATVKVSKVRRDTVPVPDDPWAGAGTQEPPADEPPF
jgi:single-strand DNA-binding protein